MKTVTEFMLTAKDVLYLSDILDQTLVLNKRIGNDLNMIESEEVKTCFTHVNELLREHYDTFLDVLKKEAK